MKVKDLGKILALASALLFTNVVLAASKGDAPASEASIRRLMDVTEVRKLVDNVSEQVNTSMQESMQRALADTPISPEQQRILDELRTKMVKVVSDSLQWAQLEPMYLEIYKKTFTQREIEGMLAFYETEAGKALIVKMPLVMQNTMQAVQSRTANLVPQIQELQREAFEKLKATKSQ